MDHLAVLIHCEHETNFDFPCACPKLNLQNIPCCFPSPSSRLLRVCKQEATKKGSSNAESSRIAAVVAAAAKKKPTHPASAGLLNSSLCSLVQRFGCVIGDTIMMGDRLRNPCKCSGGGEDQSPIKGWFRGRPRGVCLR